MSVITPSFNRDDFVEETLKSVVAQSYQNWEQLVVDDGSTDATIDIVRRYAEKDNRFRLSERDRDPKGACTCRNIAVDHSRGEYLIFLDTDDLLEPFCLEQRVRVMQHNPELDFAIFPSTIFEKEPHDLKLWWNINKPIDSLVRQLHLDVIAQGTGVIWKKDAFNRIGRWDESLSMWQDVDLFLRAYIQNYKYGIFFDLPADLHNRRNNQSMSRDGYHSPPKVASRIAVLKNAVNLLKDCGKSEYLQEARFIVAGLVSGLARVRRSKDALALERWARQQGVLSRSQGVHLICLILVYGLRLSRLFPFAGFIQRTEEKFISTQTLGKFSYTDQEIAQFSAWASSSRPTV